MMGVCVRRAAETKPPRPKRCSLYRSLNGLPTPLKPSGHTPTRWPSESSRSASGFAARVEPVLRARSPITGVENSRSAPSIRRCRRCGCSSCTATCVISASSAIVPEWLATTSAPPSDGMFSMPRHSTRNHVRYSGRSRFITTTSVNSASKPNSSTWYSPVMRRRITGEYHVDEFGFDAEFTDVVVMNLLRPLYRTWFRVECRGIENIPSDGGALVVANHSGTIALDALMTQVAVHDEHPQRRHLRMLGADLLFSTPVIGDLARKTGSTLAANPDAERLLSDGHLVGVWPEGFKGVGKPFSERYKLQRFGRGGFVSAALRTQTPIIPCAIVGAEEIYPILGNARTVARVLGLPYAPVTPTWPWLGSLGLVPLPTKWLIEFSSPITTDDAGDGGADDPMLVFDLTDQVRETIQQTLYSLLVQRRSVFF